MVRLGTVWHDVTEGQSLRSLWAEFQREARYSFEGAAGEIPGGAGLALWTRMWRFSRAMFFHLTPARRVLLLLALLVLLSVNSSRQASQQDATSAALVAAICLLLILALEVADRVNLKRDLQVARDIQNWLVPREPPRIPGLDIAFATRPANTVAGDYYDILPLPATDPERPSILLAVADVAGKGIPAGLLMACFRSCLHTLAGSTRDLGDLVARLHCFCLADSGDGRHFTTAFLAQYHPLAGSLAYINAGHNPPLLRRASGAILELDVGGLPCGAFPGTEYRVGSVIASPGDLLLIYTDGIVEAMNDAQEEYGLDRLLAFVRSTYSSSAEFQQRLFHQIEEFTGQAPQHDDMTCMVVQFQGVDALRR